MATETAVQITERDLVNLAKYDEHTFILFMSLLGYWQATGILGGEP